jgi:hypothetical protein
MQIAEYYPTLAFEPSVGNQLITKAFKHADFQLNIEALTTEQ